LTFERKIRCDFAQLELFDADSISTLSTLAAAYGDNCFATGDQHASTDFFVCSGTASECGWLRQERGCNGTRGPTTHACEPDHPGRYATGDPRDDADAIGHAAGRWHDARWHHASCGFDHAADALMNTTAALSGAAVFFLGRRGS
jgi:hypothetical protein